MDLAKMKNFLDKTKTLNYIVSAVFVLCAISFMKQISLTLWQFDIFNGKQVVAFAKFIANGRIFHSLKYISFIITFAGLCCITYSGVLISMQIKYKNDDETKETKADDVAEPKEEVKAEEVVKANEEAKTIENTNTPVRVAPTPEQRFEMYNNKQAIPTEVQPVETQAQNPTVAEENTFNNDEERTRLQSKIKEIMARMKEKSNATERPMDEVKAEPENKILSPVDFSKEANTKPIIDMNFEKISAEDNALMEQSLIGAGFKLLSEIRIGSTGIDYLGVAKDKLVVVQLDTTDGNWFASEDKVEGSDEPVWFSETGNKISPVARAIEARNNIQNLIGEEINLPIQTVACLTNSKIVNFFETSEEWEKLGVDVVRLNRTSDDENEDGIKQISELFPAQSQQAPEEAEINKLIAILEKAEVPA